MGDQAICCAFRCRRPNDLLEKIKKNDRSEIDLPDPVHCIALQTPLFLLKTATDSRLGCTGHANASQGPILEMKNDVAATVRGEFLGWKPRPRSLRRYLGKR